MEILVLPQENAVLRQNPKPRLGWAGRAVLAALIKPLPRGVERPPARHTGHGPCVASTAGRPPLDLSPTGPGAYGFNPAVSALVEQYVFFVMDVGGRFVHVLASNRQPGRAVDGPADPQPAHDLGECAQDQFKILVGDRAGQFTATFDAIPADTDITVCKIPPRSPRANAHAERFVLTARTEVTDRMLIFNKRHLRRRRGEYTRHYNGRWPHRALQLQPPRSDHPLVDLTHERIRRRPVVGELINEYERTA